MQNTVTSVTSQTHAPLTHVQARQFSVMFEPVGSSPTPSLTSDNWHGQESCATHAPLCKTFLAGQKQPSTHGSDLQYSMSLLSKNDTKYSRRLKMSNQIHLHTTGKTRLLAHWSTSQVLQPVIALHWTQLLWAPSNVYVISTALFGKSGNLNVKM